MPHPLQITFGGAASCVTPGGNARRTISLGIKSISLAPWYEPNREDAMVAGIQDQRPDPKIRP
jgi:hypothetical protein